jgi:hypothetical protein
MVVKKSWSVRLSYICQLHVGYILDDMTLYIYIASSLCCMLLEGIVAYVICIYNFYLCIQYIIYNIKYICIIFNVYII